MKKQRRKAVWDLYKDGITYSMLCRWLVCRERFRVYVVDGLRERETFNHKMEYGSMFHAMEENHDNDKNFRKANQALQRYCHMLKTRFMESTEKIDYWSDVCRSQFPVYCLKWAKDDTKKRWLFRERSFEVAILQHYDAKKGETHTVKMRGKWDGVYMAGAKSKTLVLQENKTKGIVDESGITGALFLDLQTMIYLTALNRTERKCHRVLYNVIRRPLSDMYAPRQKKTETHKAFMLRLRDEHIAKKKDHFFKRWDLTFTEKDITEFKRKVLFPMLEQLCQWWDWITHARDNNLDPFTDSIHWQTPFGVFNPLAVGMHGDYWELMTSGSTRGLTPVYSYYPELDDADCEEKRTKNNKPTTNHAETRQDKAKDKANPSRKKASRRQRPIAG